MRPGPLLALALLPTIALAACGSDKSVNTATYTCAEFNKSLATKGDDTAGNFINGLRKQANLSQPTQVERREIALGIYFACHGKPGSTRPADKAIANAQAMKSGKFKASLRPPAKKKSGN